MLKQDHRRGEMEGGRESEWEGGGGGGGGGGPRRSRRREGGFCNMI